MVLMLKVYNDNIDIDIGVTVDGEVVVGRDDAAIEVRARPTCSASGLAHSAQAGLLALGSWLSPPWSLHRHDRAPSGERDAR